MNGPLTRLQSQSLWVFVMLAMTACGDDNDTILTGFSGVIIFGIIAWIIYRKVSSDD